MARKLSASPTLAGAASVLIWGSAVPIVKVVEDRIGLLAFMGFNYAAMAMFGIIIHLVRRSSTLPQKAIFRNRTFYAQWFFFVLHEGLLAAGIYLVERKNMPFLILINYLWPTAIILCSVILGTVTIRKWWAFLAGSFVVILGMLPELFRDGMKSNLFERRIDCLAYVLVFIGAISWGMYSALSRRVGTAGSSAMALPIFQATLGLALPISFLPAMATWKHLTVPSALLLLAYSSLLSVSYIAWDTGMRRGNVVALSLMADFIPWLSLLATGVMLHMAIGRTAVLSAALLISGAIVARYGTLQNKPLIAAYDEPGF